MFNSTVLEVAIGLVFIYFLFTTLCSAIQEGIASWMGLRAKELEKAIIQLIGPDNQKKLYSHPLISGLIELGKAPSAAAPAVGSSDAPNRAKPQYIEPKTFSRALVDILTDDKPPTFEELEKAVKSETTGIKKAVRALMSGLTTVAESGAERGLQADAEGLREVKLNIENWYNDAMERLCGRYKRNSQVIILAIAAIVSLVCNVDTLAIANSLARNTTLRAAVVSVAQRETQRSSSIGSGGSTSTGMTPTSGQDGQGLAEPLKKIADEVQKLNALQVPLGWSWSGSFSRDPGVWVRKIIGLLISAIGLTLGAPFWFDVLNRVVNVRTAGNRPDTEQKN